MQQYDAFQALLNACMNSQVESNNAYNANLILLPWNAYEM